MRVLLIGPLPSPITGVSLTNQVVLSNIREYSDTQISAIDTNYKALKEDIGTFDLKKVFFSLQQYKNIFNVANVDKVYMTTGQTFFGVLKYFPYFLLSKLYKKEIIIHVHGNHLWKEYKTLRGIKKKIFHAVLSMSNKGIVLSASLKKNLTPFLALQNIYVLENFVEEYLYTAIPKKNTTSLRVIYLSNLMKEKGIFDLLETLLELKRLKVPFEAQIAGGVDPSTKTELDKYIKALSGHVTYLGVVSGENKKRMLEWGNVFVFPTYYAMEGQPIAVFEAMATGNIILTTRHAGIPDIFQNNINGFYIDKKSPPSITDRLLDINKNLQKYRPITEYNKREAKEKYRVNIFISKLYSILADTACKN